MEIGAQQIKAGRGMALFLAAQACGLRRMLHALASARPLATASRQAAAAGFQELIRRFLAYRRDKLMVQTAMEITSILAYVDTRRRSGEARQLSCLESLARLAVAHNARLLLCDVLESAPDSAGPNPTFERVTSFRRRHALDTLAKFSSELRPVIDAAYIVLDGNPFLEITRYAIKHRVDLVACAGSAEPDNRVESTGSHLTRKCPTSVWLMGERGAGHRREIVVAVDRDIFPASQTPRAMATRLLDAAVDLARGESGTIHLVHAWEIYGAEWLDKLREGFGANEVKDYVDAQRYSHTLWLEELHEQLRTRLKFGSHAGMRSATHLLEGPAGEVITAWLASNDADVLVMGTLGISGTPGLFIGNTAETLISRVAVPVLAIKPLGFRSPVEA